MLFDTVRYCATLAHMKQHTALRIEQEHLAKLERLAKEQDRTVAYMIRKAISEFLDRQTKRGHRQ
jgi:predicted transcriptional regulator